MRSPGALVTVLMLVALLVGGAVFCSPAAFALERAGTVVAVRGKVEVDREGARSRLRVKDPIYVVDTIYTNNGRVQLMFSDHSLVSLGRNTVLTVSEYRYRPQAGEGALKTRVTEGVFRVVGGAITRLAPENFTTETPTATIGIRGSMYSGIYRNQTLSVLFEGGRGIFVRNQFGSTDLSRPNLLTTVLPNKPPAPPKRATPADLQQFYKELAAPVADEQGQGGEGAGAADAEGGQETTGDDGGQQTADGQQGEGGGPGVAAAAGGQTGQGEESAGGETGGQAGAPGLDLLGATGGEDGGGTGLLAGNLDETEAPAADPLGGAASVEKPLATVQDVVDTVVNDAVQQQVTEQVEESVAGEAQAGGAPAAQGAFLASYTPDYTDPAVSFQIWKGVTVLEDAGGGVFAGAEVAADGTSFPLRFDESSGSVTDWGQEVVFDRSLTVDGTAFDQISTDVLFSEDHLFHLWFGHGSGVFGGDTRFFYDIGFAGVPTVNPPANGVSLYEGVMAGLPAYTDGTPEWWITTALMWSVVDHETGAFFAVADGYEESLLELAFLFGRTSGAALTDIGFLAYGEREADNVDCWVLGDTDSFTGSLYGSAGIGFGVAGERSIKMVQGGARLGSLSLLAAAGRMKTLSVSRTGATLHGFMAGAMEAHDPASGALRFLNAAWDRGSLALTPSASGGISGGLYIEDLLDSGIDSTSLVDGAAVGDDLFFAVTEPFPNGVMAGVYTDLLEDRGLFPGAVWGRMALPYDSGEGLWIASSRPDLDISRVITGTSSVHALFSGPARALFSDPAAAVHGRELLGTAAFDFDLGANTFTGTLDFGATDRLSAEGPLSGAGFSSATIRDADGVAFADAGLWGRLAGSDTTDAVLLGSFYAKRSGDTGALYTGIFGGAFDKTVTTSPPTASVSQTGAFLSALFNTTDGVLVEGWFGTVTLDDADGDGVLTGEMRDAATGSARPLALDETSGTPDLPKPGFSLANTLDLNRTVNLLGADWTFDSDAVIFDNVDHAFRLFGGQANFSTTVSYGYSDFGYAGVPTPALPTFGGGSYIVQSAGLLSYSATQPVDGIFASGELWVNFAAGTVVGYLRGSDPLGNIDVDLPLEDAFVYGALTAGNDFSSLHFIAGGRDALLSGATLAGGLFMDSARGMGFTVEGTAEDYVTGSPLGSFQMVAAGPGDVSATPWPLSTVQLTGTVKGIEEYVQADGTLSGLDVIFGPLLIGLTSSGDISASSYLSSVFGGDSLPNVQAATGAAVSDYIFGAVLDNGVTPATGRMPPGALFTEYPSFDGVPPLASLDVDHTVAWGRMLLPGVDPNNDIEALWAATSLPAYDVLASPPAQPQFYRGKMRVMQARLPSGLEPAPLQGTAEILVDFSSKTWRGKLALASSEIQVNGSIDDTGMLTLASAADFPPAILDGSPVGGSGVEMSFFGASAPDLLLGDWYTDISGQSDLYTGVVVAEPVAGSTMLAGAYLGGPAYLLPLGSMVGVNNAGAVWGWASPSLFDGSTVSFVPFDSVMPAPASGSWSELTTKPFSYTDTYWTGGNSFVGERHVSSTGDFGYWLVPPTTYTTPTGAAEQFQMLAVLGATPTGLPTSAASEVWRFAGAGLEMYGDLATSGAYVLPSFQAAVNWSAKKFIAVFEPTGASGPLPLERIFFVADVDPSALDNPLANLTPLGVSACPYTAGGLDVVSLISAMSGARFAGTFAQGLVFQAGGQFFDLASDLTAGGATFRILAAGLTSGTPASAGTGTAILEGFVTGLAENMLDPASGRMEFMNANPGGLTLNIDRDAGTVSGTLGAMDQAAVTGASNSLDLNLGGVGRASAFIDDQLFIAQIGDDSGVGISVSGSATTLKDSSGNYLVPAPPSEQGAAYATWGYWEAAWTDPSSGAPYHLHPPGSYWVAGERTPASVIQGLIDSQATAVYQGQATGVRIDTATPSALAEKLPPGTLDLTFDFGAASVTGSIAFPADSVTGFAGKTLPVAGGAGTVTTSGFSAQVTDAVTSTVNGAFYGPSAESVGGNFRAEYSGERYMGVFVGDKQ